MKTHAMLCIFLLSLTGCASLPMLPIDKDKKEVKASKLAVTLGYFGFTVTASYKQTFKDKDQTK